MLCPNCKEKMNEDVVDQQAILHCSNCGGTFFQENGINRISITAAEMLASDKKINAISNGDKLCPRDHIVLTALRSEESIPQDVILLRCDTCRGIFAQPNDLVIFKKAQSVKIDYFKIWGIPLPSIKSIAVMSFLLFVSVISLLTYSAWQKQNIYRIQAEDLVQNIFVTTSNRYLFISFKTLLPLRSRIIFTDTTTKQKIEKVISSKAATFHQLTTADVNIENDIYYQIILTDEKGRETKTEIKRLEVN